MKPSVEEPIRGTWWSGLQRQVGQGLVERRRDQAGRSVLGHHGLLWCGAGTSAEDALGHDSLRKLGDGPRLDETGLGVNPGCHALVAGVGAGRRGARATDLLLVLARTSVAGAGGTSGGCRCRWRRSSGGSVGGDTSGAGGGEHSHGRGLLRTFGDPDLLLEKERACLKERHGWIGGGDGGDAVAELVVEPAQEVDDEVLVGEGRADVTQGVRKDLDLATVLGDGHVSLVQRVERLTSLDSALNDVVKKL